MKPRIQHPWIFQGASVRPRVTLTYSELNARKDTSVFCEEIFDVSYGKVFLDVCKIAVSDVYHDVTRDFGKNRMRS